MATIALRPSLFSLLVTLVSVLTELALLSALLRFNTLLQCRRLSRGATLSIARHRRCTTQLALLTMLLFVLIELLASANTITVFSVQTIRQPCTQFSPLFPQRSGASGAEVALYSCLRVNGLQFSVFAGNHSSVTDAVRCAQSFAFRYQNLQRVSQPLADDGVMRCTPSAFCAIARARGRTLFTSEAFELPSDDVDQSQLLRFLPTQLSFAPAPHLPMFAMRTAQAFEQGITDELDLRRRVIMGWSSGSCLFTSDGEEQTQIPAPMLGATIAVWVLSVLLFILSLSLRAKVHFDMNNQMHWANRVRRQVDDETEATLLKLAAASDGSAATVYLINKHAA